jgi:hypothetical protein
VAVATAAAPALERDLTAPVLCDLADVWALAAAAARTDARLPAGERARRADRYAAQAMEALTKAQRMGFFRPEACPQLLKDDRDLDSLRSQAAFQRLLSALRPIPATNERRCR